MRSEKKRILAAVCMICLLLIDVKAANDSWYIWLITDNLVGVVVAFIIFSSYPVKEFTKPFYIVWSVLGFLGEIGGYVFWYTHQIGHVMGYWITIPLNIWILGIAFFKYIEKIFITKELNIRFAKWEYFFVACMLLMLLSKSDYVWPIYFLIIFLMLWHSPFSEKDRFYIFKGILDGILIGFFLLQGKAFLFKTYVSVRYTGAYWNSNRNGALYLLVFTVFLARILICKKAKNSISADEDIIQATKRKLEFQVILNVLMSSVVGALIMYTGSRTSLIGMVIMCLFYYLIGERTIAHEKWIRIAQQFFVFIFSFVVMVPLIYYPICYLPIIRNAVRTEIKNVVKGTDIPISISNAGSVKLDEALDNMVFRYLKSDIVETDDVDGVEEADQSNNLDKEELIDNETNSDEEESPFIFDFESSQKDGYYVVQYYFTYYPERGRFEVFVPKKMYSGVESFNARLNILFALADNFTLLGHDSSEVFLYLDSNSPGQTAFWVNNEQNFILHYLYAYGVPAGVFFCLLILLGLICLIRNAIKGKVEAFVFAMFYLVFILTGLMEVVWVPGQIVLVLLFFAPLFFGESDKISEKCTECV